MAKPNQQILDFLKALNEANKEPNDEHLRHRSKGISYEYLPLDAYALGCIESVGGAFSGWDNVTIYHVRAAEFQPHLEALIEKKEADFSLAAVLEQLHIESNYNYPEVGRDASSFSVQDGRIQARLAIGKDLKFSVYDVKFTASGNEPYARMLPPPGSLVDAVRQRLG